MTFAQMRAQWFLKRVIVFSMLLATDIRLAAAYEVWLTNHSIPARMFASEEKMALAANRTVTDIGVTDVAGGKVGHYKGLASIKNRKDDKEIVDTHACRATIAIISRGHLRGQNGRPPLKACRPGRCPRYLNSPQDPPAATSIPSFRASRARADAARL
jgi:hypothetical protein